jgi:hypothetical protein
VDCGGPDSDPLFDAPQPTEENGTVKTRLEQGERVWLMPEAYVRATSLGHWAFFGWNAS